MAHNGESQVHISVVRVKDEVHDLGCPDPNKETSGCSVGHRTDGKTERCTQHTIRQYKSRTKGLCPEDRKRLKKVI